MRYGSFRCGIFLIRIAYKTTTDPASYPATRKIPTTLHDQADKNAEKNSPHRIRTVHPTIQNY